MAINTCKAQIKNAEAPGHTGPLGCWSGSSRVAAGLPFTINISTVNIISSNYYSQGQE